MELTGFALQLAYGTAVTVRLALTAMAVAIAIGVVGALAKQARGPARWLATGYTTLVRGLPELLVILLVYYGAIGVLNAVAPWFGYDGYVELSPFVAGTVALAFNYGAYMTEVFRGALQTIPRGHIEAGTALGLRRGRIFRRIVLPQVWRVALPATGNIFMALMKDTALISVIGVEDLMRETSIAVAATQEPFTWYLAAAVVYLAMTALASGLIHWLEQRTSHGMRTLQG